MASTGISVLQMAVNKQQNRRQLGTQAGKLGMTDGVFLEDLEKIGGILLASMPKKTATKGARDNYATVVTGYMSYDGNGHEKPLLFAVMKLANTTINVQAELYQQGVKLKLIQDPDQVIFIDDVPTNLHAEMAIVYYLCKRVGYEKQHLGGLLEIYCSGKGVCQDCSGWMTKHGIVHAPLSGAPSATGWKNPLSGALYKASGENLQYTKGLLALSAFNHNDGGEYKGKVKL
jgi:hypothetical protein